MITSFWRNEDVEKNNETLVCYIGGVTNFIDSASMTVEKCLEICIITYGFRYAGLQEYLKIKINKIMLKMYNY